MHPRVVFYPIFLTINCIESRHLMDPINVLSQILQLFLGLLPGALAANLITLITIMVTLCTLILRFWKEPSPNSKFYKLWKIIHIIAAFKIPTSTIEEEIRHDKTE